MSRFFAAIRRILRTLNGEKLGPVPEMHIPTQDIVTIEEPEAIYARPVDGL